MMEAKLQGMTLMEGSNENHPQLSPYTSNEMIVF